jgi:bifunctional non-homologous end joining protein LigD
VARETYSEKRSFGRTPEPASARRPNVDPGAAPAGERFVIHQHHARRLHFDLRLEMIADDTGVLVSWAIPRGLPLRTGDPRLAVHVEDHPIEYATFSGIIPKGNYGAGEVRIFDTGSYELLEQARGKLTIRLVGSRLRGVWHLTRTRAQDGKDEWLVLLREDERPAPQEPPDLTPMLATPHPEPFDDGAWLFEPKWDGVRALAVCRGETRLLSRTRRDITDVYPELGTIHEHLVATEAVLDGEIVAFEAGRPSFEKLQSRINLQNRHDIERARKAIPVTYMAFDLLYLDRRSTADLPLERRKDMLGELVVTSEALRVSSPCVEGEGIALSRAAREQRLEGIVGKKLGSPYRPGRRTREWLKIKVVHEVDVVVGGWSVGEGSRSDAFGSLLVGVYESARLCFVGAVGTGFDHASLGNLLAELKRLQTSDCPFGEDCDNLRLGRFGKPLKDPRWVEPRLVAKVEFRELTSGVRLRAPSFKGLRTDKLPEDCRLEDLRAAAAGPAGDDPTP